VHARFFDAPSPHPRCFSRRACKSWLFVEKSLLTADECAWVHPCTSAGGEMHETSLLALSCCTSTLCSESTSTHSKDVSVAVAGRAAAGRIGRRWCSRRWMSCSAVLTFGTRRGQSKRVYFTSDGLMRIPAAFAPASAQRLVAHYRGGPDESRDLTLGAGGFRLGAHGGFRIAVGAQGINPGLCS
jgi:hypothetical protein